MLQEIIPAAKGSWPELLVGNDTADDAAVVRINGDQAIISTADFFLPIVDDPFEFGQIAAANSISDVYAMGGTPLMAIALLGWPIEKLPASAAKEVLEGARAICEEAGIPLAGGHTIDSSDPIFGLSVTGHVQITHLKKNSGGKAGDLLFLTKPLGSGVLSTALKRDVLQTEHKQALTQQLTSLNSIGALLGKMPEVHAVTDITGFGLAGHLGEMAKGSGLSARLQYSALHLLPGVKDYVAQRIIPDATYRNWNSYGKQIGFDKTVPVMEAFNILPDPQTNGGLLIAIDPAAAESFSEWLKDQGFAAYAQPIGKLIEPTDKLIQVY